MRAILFPLLLSLFGSATSFAKSNPKILFHGGGGGAPKSAIDLSPLRHQFQEQGVPAEDIYQVHYPHSKDIVDIVTTLRPQLDEILSKYPVDTKFDLIGHSLGHAVSLISLAKLNLISKIGKLIGLAGVMFGQYGQKPGLCRIGLLAPYFCGDIFDLLLGTTEPPVVMDILERYDEELEKMEKCSLYSPEDGILDPYDSGAFKDGINISLPNVHHLKFKSSPVVFEAMKKHCFQDEF